ncbi:MAG TPA: nitrile hydratase subunit beta [Steroidobacteraceae bacterium]|nr:nitrile hydratase subunit beta [Steroidobacteraceae bacterium]
MNGIHDMGGMQDMGPVRPEKNEPVFHAAWEGRVFAMDLAIDGDWPGGSGRYQRELIPPADYLRMSYYERWLTGLSELLVKSGMVTRTELETGVARGGNTKGRHMLRADEVAAMIAAGDAATRDVPVAAKFNEGQRVRARNVNPVGHTRLPRYARGKQGTIVRDRGVHVFNDSLAQGRGEKPQHLYSVRFAARELWGPQAPTTDSVYVDLWDDHLEAA